MNTKKEMALIFNKDSGEMLATIDYNQDMNIKSDYTVFKIVSIDTLTEVYVGDYENGSIRNIDDVNAELANKVVIFEENVNNMAGTKITKEYPLEKQLNIISNALVSLCKKDESINSEELEKMTRYINHTITNNKRIKSVYEQSENHILVKKNDLSDKIDRELSGQLLSAMGTPDLRHRRKHRTKAEDDS